MLVVEILIFGFVLWLGSYLISRNPADARLSLAGAGLVAYAVGLALGILAAHIGDAQQSLQLLFWQRVSLVLAAVLWLVMLLNLLKAHDPWYSRLKNHRNPMLVVFTATIFFGLGLGFLIIPAEWIPRGLIVAGLGIDFLMLGFAVAFLDAFDEGEALLPHSVQSFMQAFMVALIFGGQVALVLLVTEEESISLLILLIGSIGAAIFLVTFSGRIQSALSQLAPGQSPLLKRERDTYRQAANNVARKNEALDLARMGDPEFTRLTRRALSHMGNLPRLTASPLTGLPIIDDRLLEKGKAQDSLQRAGELREVLSESIARLRPMDDGEFGITDAWRHYNALYYPYVIGLKPYSRRLQAVESSSDYEGVIAWFRSQVPQRTLYNWQNEAASLVAQDLRERSWPGS